MMRRKVSASAWGARLEGPCLQVYNNLNFCYKMQNYQQ
jgi:hypothetical protein